MDQNAIQQDANPDLRLAAERVASEAEGRVVHFSSMVRLTEEDRHSIVYRCIDENGKSFILKQSPAFSLGNLENWEEAPWEAKGFLNDWIGAEFLSGLGITPPVSPQFFGGDIQMGFFLLEDLGTNRNLTDPLLRGDPGSAEISLIQFSKTLGRLHARTAGRNDQFDDMYRQRFPAGRPFAFEKDELGPRKERITTNLAELGISIHSELQKEIDQIIEDILNPGPFLTYIHSDPCPDNQFNMGSSFVLIDFETGHFGHALIDAVYPRMVWPSCWCAARLPIHLIELFEFTYRSELAVSVHEVQDDNIWDTAFANICGLSLLNTFTIDQDRWLKGDFEWGISTIRQRILARLEAFIETTDKFHRLPEMRGMAEIILTDLQTRWTNTPKMPLYPAFQRGQQAGDPS